MSGKSLDERFEFVSPLVTQICERREGDGK